MRNRLLASVALCAVAVLAAGTPAVLDGSHDVTESQGLVDQAELNKRAIALSHVLSDERDGMVEYVASSRAGQRPARPGEVPAGAGGESQRARVDRQIKEVTASAYTPADLKERLAAVPALREDATTGQPGPAAALKTYKSYSEAVDALHTLSASLVRDLPARAQSPTADSLPDFARAVGQASGVRGLLRGALAGTGTQPELTAEAQRARVREEAALADFEQTAGSSARDAYDATVTGTDVTLADRYAQKLTDRPYLTPADRLLSRERMDTALSARVDGMRSVQASFAAQESDRLEKLRDDDVTALELRITLAGVCLLVAVGIGVQTARSMTRPLSVLRRGSQRLAADPAGEEPVVFTGKNDEFAEVVRALNTLREFAAALQERATEAEADNTFLVDGKDRVTAELDRLRRDHHALRDEYEAMAAAVDEARAEARDAHEAAEAAAQESAARDTPDTADDAAAEPAGSADDGVPEREGAPAPAATFVNLGLRTLGLVERQLAVIEGLEEKESDPDQLGTLFKLDHLATRMRRHSENLLLLAGAEHTTQHGAPVPLLDVLRAAISEIERYERVELGSLPPHTQLTAHAADDISHLVAELLDNAAAFSPPDAGVRLSAWLLESGEVMLSVHDEGIGVTDEMLAALNARLGEPRSPRGSGSEPGSAVESLGMGLYVVARLACRHELRVQLHKHKQGGVTAVVTVPKSLVHDRPAVSATPPGGGGTSLPGSVAEANSNDLPVRRPRRHAAERVPAPRSAPDTGTAADTEDTEDTEAADTKAADTKGAAPEPDRAPEPEAGASREHEHTRDEAPSAPRESAPAEPAPRVTDKGLPKRTPRNVASEQGRPRPRTGGANADELRRRLGGFQQGAQHGRRDAEAEAAAEENENGQAGAQIDGGTAEEARK